MPTPRHNAASRGRARTHTTTLCPTCARAVGQGCRSESRSRHGAEPSGSARVGWRFRQPCAPVAGAGGGVAAAGRWPPPPRTAGRRGQAGVASAGTTSRLAARLRLARGGAAGGRESAPARRPRVWETGRLALAVGGPDPRSRLCTPVTPVHGADGGLSRRQSGLFSWPCILQEPLPKGPLEACRS